MDNSSSNKNLHTGHRKRVKTNVCENGFSHMEDHKLLELILFYSIPQADTNGLAHTILSEFGSFEEMMKADVNRLKRIKGVGENTAILLASMGETFRRVAKEKLSDKARYETTEDFGKLALSYLKSEQVEKVMLFCLDGAGRLKKAVTLSEGNEFSSKFNAREAIEAIIDCKATKAFLAHNHPVGEAEPSYVDVDTTRTLSLMFRKLGVLLVEHVILGEKGTIYSMYSDTRYRGLFS